MSRYRSLLLMGCMLGIGFCLGAADKGIGFLQAEVRKSEPPEAFLSGGARSEKVLREISETIKRIEGQIGRIEKTISSPPKN